MSKNLVFKGVLRAIKVKTLSALVTNLNNLSADELSSLKGITSNIQTQMSTLANKMENVLTQQTAFKSTLSAAVQKKKRFENSHCRLYFGGV